MSISKATYLRIEELCEKNSMSVNKLCDLSDITHSTVFSFRDGKSKNPGLKTIYKLCNVLDITLSEFFDSTYFDDLND